LRGGGAGAAVDLINKKEHLTLEGLNKILALKSSLNKGLPSSLKEAFSCQLKKITPR
jgi:hypothetical protein